MPLRRAVVMSVPWPSNACQVVPEVVGAARRDALAELDRPRALAAELRAPGPEPPRGEVQRVLVREADRAVHLVHEAGAHACGFADADLRRRDLEAWIAGLGGLEGELRRDAGGRDVAGHHREVVLQRLEVADR